MDLNHVTAFVRVVQDGSFTAAARALGLPKSSVSRSVAQLEHDLGVRLLHRTTRKLHLTDAGTAFHDRVARALADIDEATTATSDLQRDLRGTIRISAPFDLGVWAIAGIVTRFVKRNAGVSIEARLSSRAVDLAAEGFDLAVRAGALRDDSLIARKAGRLDLGLYASSKWVARHGEPKDLAELERRPCVAFRSDAGTMPWSLRGPNGEEATIVPRGAICADDISFLKKAVLAGAGIALLPSFLAAREERAKKLVRVLPSFRYEGGELHVVYPSARYVPQRVIAFREFLVAELGKITRRCEALDARA